MSGLDDAAAALTAERDALRDRADRIDEVLAMLAGLGVEPEAALPPAAATPVASTPRPDIPNQCSECGRSFNRPAGLTRHLRETHGIGKRTKAADRKERQRARQAEENEDTTPDDDLTEPSPPAKPAAGHTCEVCGTTFLTRGSLASHRHREDHYLEDEPA